MAHQEIQNLPFVYVIDRRASGDTTHATASMWEALDWLRRDSHKEAALVILDYETGRRVGYYDFGRID